MQRSKSTPKLSYIGNSVQKQQQQKPTHQNELISKTPIRYGHGYTPIKPKRYLVKKSCCYTVLSNVECQIETIKTSCKKDNTMIVNEIYRFRFDEDKIWVYKCKKPVTFNLHETPRYSPNAPCYSHDLLPAEYWFMYSNACRFMNFVRSKLPMITYYTDVAKTVLFDLPGFFEIVFFADSTRIIYNRDLIRIVKANGEEWGLINVDSFTLPDDIKSLLDKASDLLIEASREIYPKDYPKVIRQIPHKQTNQN